MRIGLSILVVAALFGPALPVMAQLGFQPEDFQDQEEAERGGRPATIGEIVGVFALIAAFILAFFAVGFWADLRHYRRRSEYLAALLKQLGLYVPREWPDRHRWPD